MEGNESSLKEKRKCVKARIVRGAAWAAIVAGVVALGDVIHSITALADAAVAVCRAFLEEE